jgi:hypothetical protein
MDWSMAIAFKSLVMRKCNFVILLATKEGENVAWWQDLRCALHITRRKLGFCNQSICDYL